MQAVADYDRPVDIAIETKHPTRYTGLWSAASVDLADSFGGRARTRRPGDELLVDGANRVKKLPRGGDRARIRRTPSRRP